MLQRYVPIIFLALVIVSGFSLISYAGEDEQEPRVPGLGFFDDDEFPELAALQKKADSGDVQAQFTLGVAYDAGHMVTQNYEDAVRWYRKAADQGLAEAQYNLGVAYSYGHGVKKDPVEAVKWYRKAADQGMAKAQYNLGLAYSKGTGVPQDYEMAAQWYQTAAEQGLPQAQYNLGIVYDTGLGVQRNRQNAYFWLNLSAVSGNEGFRAVRDEVAQYLTSDQLRNTQLMTRHWQPSPVTMIQ